MHDQPEPDFCTYGRRDRSPSWLTTNRKFRNTIKRMAVAAGELPEPGSIGAFNLMVRSIVRDAVVPRVLQVKASKRRPVMECHRG